MPAKPVTRRAALGRAAGSAAAVLCGVPLEEARAAAAAAEGAPWAGFPRQEAKLVRSVVGAAHGREAQVRELVQSHPALVNAWWDWGFGDWESPLGAASHTGQRAIAEFLLEQGARIDLFAAAMLGMLDVVKAFVAARPGVQRTLGPHGIPLLVHAKLGGERAKETAAYLESLGDAGIALRPEPLAEGQQQRYVGRYALDGEGGQRIAVRAGARGQLTLELRDVDGETISRMLQYRGTDEFSPAGVPSVRLRFDVRDGRAASLAVVDREPVVTARRVEE